MQKIDSVNKYKLINNGQLIQIQLYFMVFTFYSRYKQLLIRFVLLRSVENVRFSTLFRMEVRGKIYRKIKNLFKKLVWVLDI